MTETAIMQKIQRLAQKLLPKGSRLMRNNVGLFLTQYGKPIKTGLRKGSSDLIGFTPIQVTKGMIGKKLAVFTAVEVKVPGKKPTKEQANFLNQVKRAGGIGFVATSPDDLHIQFKKFMNLF